MPHLVRCLLGDDNILKDYYMQYSKQARKLLASSDEKNVLFFLDRVKRKSDFKNFLRENELDSPYILLQISLLNLIRHIYFFIEKN